MKKIIVLIVTIIIALIIAATMLVNIIKKSEDNTIINPISDDLPSNITESTDKEYEENLRIAPRNITIAMNRYSGSVTQGMLEKDLYKLIVKHIPKIYDEIKTLSEEQIGEYFDRHTTEVNDMNMYQKEEFILICKDIQTNITEKNKNDMPIPIIELTTCEDTVENFSFELLLKYSDANILRIKIILSKTQEKIEYQKYDELKDIFSKYNGPVTKQEIIQEVSSVVVNAKKIYESCRNLSLNKILQNYDLNKSEFIKLGICSGEDYLKLTNQIVRVTWNKNPEYIGFTADVNTLKANETYTSFSTNINYSTEQSIKITMSVINSEELINENNPKIKITAELEES